MTPRRTRASALGLALALALLVAGCRGGSATSTPSPAGSATPTGTAAPVGTPVTSLRQVDFSEPSIAGELINRAGGGEVQQNRVLYAKLIAGDPTEQAVVIVDSGGTAGEIGAGIYRLVEGRPSLVQFLRYNGRVEVDQDLVVTLEGVYQPSDSQSSPSQLRETTYHWNGTTFAVLTQQVIPNPSR